MGKPQVIETSPRLNAFTQFPDPRIMLGQGILVYRELYTSGIPIEGIIGNRAAVALPVANHPHIRVSGCSGRWCLRRYAATACQGK